MTIQQIGYALAGVCDPLRHKQDDAFVLGQSQGFPGLLLVLGTEHVGIDGVGDAHHLLVLQQGTASCLVSQPAAACHETDAVPLHHALLPLPYAAGQLLTP